MRDTFSVVEGIASAAVSRMVTVQDKAYCVIWLTESKSNVRAQCHFRHTYGRDFRVCNAIRRWFIQRMGSGSVEKRKSCGRLRAFEEDAERLRLSCQHSPRKSTARGVCS